MNLQNLDHAIAIMKRAGKVNMYKWQAGGAQVCGTEEELHTCGTAACFAGWVAVSPEWKADGGSIDCIGAPTLKDSNFGRVAIAHWLDIPYELAASIVFGDLPPGSGFSLFYNKLFGEVSGKDVITRLVEIKEKGVVQTAKDYINFLSTREIEDNTICDYTLTYKRYLSNL